jgi:DNA processing protein
MAALARRTLSDAERLDWLRLSRTENIGPVTFFRLVEHFGSATGALEALPQLARRGGRAKPLHVPTSAQAEKEMTAIRRLGGRMLAACEPGYPEPLAAVEDAPPLISVLGRVDLLLRPSIAIVGARNASLNGRRIAENLARDLGASGLAVASGLARGIDTSAHGGSIGTGTVAVLAGGADVVYPPENRQLYQRIAAEGAVVAECAVGTQPQARHFPRRNRIISGLSRGVVVVEAALRSGSLITARFALEQGREVFAVPGSPLDPRCHGTNNLLRQGAVLTETADDVLRVLGESRAQAFAEPPVVSLPVAADAGSAELESARAIILESLSPSPLPVDEVIRQCHLSPAAALTAMLELELAGRIQRQPGNRVNLI